MRKRRVLPAEVMERAERLAQTAQRASTRRPPAPPPPPQPPKRRLAREKVLAALKRLHPMD